jgi:glycerol-3-phosphate acyltransferase PlsY
LSPNSFDGLIIGLISYLMGGIPTAYLAARLLKGQDIRRVGDHNVGAANVYRNIGSGAGVAVGMIDIIKGSAAVLLARGLFDSTAMDMIAGVAVVAGHNWPVYFRLRGGRGAATAVGVLLVMLPALAIPLGLSAGAILCLTKKSIISLGFFLVCVPVIAWWPAQYPASVVAFAVGIPLLVGVGHYLSVKRQPAPEPRSDPALPQG